MLKALAYLMLALSVLPFVVFGYHAINEPWPHGLLPVVLGWFFASLFPAIPFLFAAAVFFVAHRVAHPAAHRVTAASDDERNEPARPGGKSTQRRVSLSQFGR